MKQKREEKNYTQFMQTNKQTNKNGDKKTESETETKKKREQERGTGNSEPY